jgi:hypothetical protein
MTSYKENFLLGLESVFVVVLSSGICMWTSMLGAYWAGHRENEWGFGFALAAMGGLFLGPIISIVLLVRLKQQKKLNFLSCATSLVKPAVVTLVLSFATFLGLRLFLYIVT